MCPNLPQALHLRVSGLGHLEEMWPGWLQLKHTRWAVEEGGERGEGPLAGARTGGGGDVPSLQPLVE